MKIVTCDNCGVDCTDNNFQSALGLPKTLSSTSQVNIPLAQPTTIDLCQDCHDGIKTVVGQLPFGNRAASGDVVIKSRAKKPKV